MEQLVISLLSAIGGGGFVAAINVFSTHHFAKKRDAENRKENDRMQAERDKTNREENEKIQRRAEIRQYGALEDQRRELEHVANEKERINAVTKYYIAHLKAFSDPPDYHEKLNAFTIATNIFRMEVAPLDSDMPKQVEKITQLASDFNSSLAATIDSYHQRNAKVTKKMIDKRESIFEKLMLWGYDSKAYRFGEYMDNMIKEIDDW